MKDNEIAQLVNELREVAYNYHDTQQLRSRIANLLVPKLKQMRADILQEAHEVCMEAHVESQRSYTQLRTEEYVAKAVAMGASAQAAKLATAFLTMKEKA